MAEANHERMEDLQRRITELENKIENFTTNISVLKNTTSINAQLWDEIRRDYSLISEQDGITPGELEQKLRNLEEKLQQQGQHVTDLERRVNQREEKTPFTEGHIKWLIPVKKMEESFCLIEMFSLFTIWKFQLQLFARGMGVGKDKYVSLVLRLVDSGVPRPNICPCEVTIMLKNLDQIHPIKGHETPRPDFCVTVEAGELSKENNVKKFETFFPKSVFERFKGFVIEDNILIEAIAEAQPMSASQSYCNDWVTNCEPRQ